MDVCTEVPVSFHLPWCKKCGICVSFCPKKCLAVGDRGYPELADAEACSRCRLCEMMCPDFAITVAERPRKGRAEEA